MTTKFSRLGLLALSVATLALTNVSRVEADTVFFSDTFNRANSLNLDDSTNGMGGVLITSGAVAAGGVWNVPVDISHPANPNDSCLTNNQLKMGGNGHTVYVFQNFNYANLVSNGTVSVSMILTNNGPGGTGTGAYNYDRFVGIGVGFSLAAGNANGNTGTWMQNNADLFVEQTSKGAILVYDGAAAGRNNGANYNLAVPLAATTTYLNGTLRIDLMVTNTAAGSNVVYNVLWGSGGVFTNVITGRSFAWTGDNQFYIGTEERSTPPITNDNFTVTAIGAYTPPPVTSLVWRATANNAWDTSSINWVDGGLGLGDYAFFTGANVTFNDNTANAVVNVPGSVTPGNMIVNNVSSNYMFSGAGSIGGAGNLTKLGTGTATMSLNNGYTGGTMISVGRLRVGDNNALGSGVVTMSGGVISSDSGTARALANAIVVTANSGFGDAADNGALTFNGLLNFNGSGRTMTVNANSTLIFTGGATNGTIASKQGTGTLIVQGGLAEVTGSCDAQDGALIFDGATVHSTDRVISDAGTVNGIGRLVITNGATVSVSNTVGNLRSGRVASAGSNYVDLAGLYLLPNADAADGKLTLQNNAAYSEVTFWPGGDFTARSVGPNGTGSNPTVFKFNGGILRARNDNTAFFEGLSQTLVQSGGANIDDGGFAITINQALLDGTGGGGLNKTGTGTLTLGGTNNYTGNTVVSNGTLVVTTTNFTSGGLVVKDGAALSVVNRGTVNIPVSSLTMGVAGTSTLNLNFPSGNAASASISAGTLTGNGTVTINISGSGFAAGSIPLIAFSGGSGANFVLGSLPSGVLATLDTSASPITLNISSAIQQLVWTGAGDNQWNAISIDWTNILTGTPSQYSQSGGTGDQVKFDDSAPGSTSIDLAINATPVSMTANNSSLAYSFTGSGSIAGAGTLIKSGSGALTLGTVNTFTGGGTVTNGTLYVGANSALGTGVIGVGGGVMFAPAGGSFTLSNSFSSVRAGAVNFGVTNASLTLQGDMVMNNGGKTFVNGGGDLVIKKSLQLISGGAGLDIQSGSRVVLDGGFATNTDDGIRLYSSGGSAVTELNLTNNAVYVVGLSSGAPNVRLGQVASVAGTNVLRISSGLFLMTNTAQAIIVGDKLSTTGMVYQTGGSVNFSPNPSPSGILFGSVSGAYGEYHLDGGSLITPRVATTSGSSGNLYLNGGTLVASTNTFASAFLNGTAVYVSAGGANIDDGGFAITINQALQDNGGGLTKLNSGTLTLTANNTYTGNTVISAGTLALTGSGAISASPNITINPGAALNVSGTTPTYALGAQTLHSGDGAGGAGALTGSLNLGSGALALNYLNATPSLSVAGGTLNFSGNAVTVTVSGSPLGVGSYLLVATNAAGLVSGTLPATVTVNGAGTLAGTTNLLAILDNQLYLMVTHAPVAGDNTYTRNGLNNWQILISDLLTNATDVDLDTLSLSSVGTSTNGVTLTISGGYVQYSNANLVDDQFTYTVADTSGATSTGVITLAVGSSSGVGGQVSNIAFVGGTPSMTFAGIPGYLYNVQVSTNISLPGGWTTIHTTNAPSGGVFFFQDNNPPSPQAFYRLMWNGN